MTALRELTSAAKRWDAWFALAWADTKSRYRRTTIGPFWLTLSTGATIGSVGLVYAGLFGLEISEYLPYFGVGLIIWTFLSTAVTEGCNVLIAAAGYIKSVPLPLATHVFRMLARNAIILAHNAVLIGLLWILFRWDLHAGVALAALGLLINVVVLSGVAITFGIICARYRDVPQIVTSLMTLLFLLTPIMWSPKTVRAPIITVVVTWNPFSYLVEVVRAPILGQPVDDDVWMIAAALALAALAVGLFVYGKYRHRVAYWL